jgi:hypothetical protein
MVRSRVLSGLFVAICVCVAAVGDDDAKATPTAGATHPAQAVGVTLSPGPGGEDEAFELFLSVGANAIEAPQPWRTLERARRRYHLGDVAAIVAGLASEPTKQIMVIPAVIETTRRSVPGDLRRVPWDSRRMVSRYRTLLHRLADHLSPQVRYLSIANEADVYLGAHPAQLPAFVRFSRREIAEAHRLVPWAKVGVTVTYVGLTAADPHVARTLARLGDATIATYYPLAGAYRMRPPRAPLDDIPRMVRLSHGRPLVLQEAGYSSARRLGGSPRAQATFVDSVFAAARRTPRAIPFLSFYTLFDLPEAACEDRSEAVTFFCSLGLRTGDGRPKPAWSAFRDGLRSMSSAADRVRPLFEGAHPGRRERSYR